MDYYSSNMDYHCPKIKPKLVTKIPYGSNNQSLEILDFFISMSPGLSFLRAMGSLVISIHPENTMFYVDDAYTWEDYNSRYTESTAICNLVLFAKEWQNKKEKKETLVKHNNQEYPDIDTENFDIDYFDSGKPIQKIDQRAKDILRLIRRRQRGK